MSTPILSLALAVLTAVSAAFVPLYFGRRKPGYSHVCDTISELRETGSPVGGRVSYGFISIGVLLWLSLIVAASVVPSEAAEALWWLSLVGWGYDYWSPLSSVMEYARGLVAVCLLGITLPHPFRGFIQRVAETSIFAGIVVIGAWIYRGGA
jgi:hypothetical protein